MLVLVTIQAFPAQTEERFVQIRNLNVGANGSLDVLGIVALLARRLRVLAFEREAGRTSMIELLAIQLNESELPAVMLHVAVGTVRLRG